MSLCTQSRACMQQADCPDQGCPGVAMGLERDAAYRRQFQVMHHALRRIAKNPDLTAHGMRDLANLALSVAHST